MQAFTPLNETRTKRLVFEVRDVEVINGDLNSRGYGQKAVVKIKGRTYKVIGAACSIPGCACDAVLKEVG